MRWLDILRAAILSPDAVAAVGKAVKEARKVSAARGKAVAKSLEDQADVVREDLLRRFD